MLVYPMPYSSLLCLKLIVDTLLSKQWFHFLRAVFSFVGNSEMVSALLEAGCDKNAKMGIPATITPLSLATELGLKDIIHLLSESSFS